MKAPISRNSAALGLTSFLVEVSSEMLTPIMPLFLLNVLRADTLAIGFIEGMSDLVVAAFRAISGYVSDRFGKRKRMSMLGYMVSSFAKVFFFLATSWQQVFAFKMVERFGKGIRGVPRDAIITHSERKENLGRAFGFRKMMDAGGAVLGPLIATLLVAYLLPSLGEEATYRRIFLIAVIPAILGVFIIWRFATDAGERDTEDGRHILRDVWSRPIYRDFIVLGVLFGLAQFGTAFFILKAQEITGSVLVTLFGYLVYNVSYALSAVPVGILTDKLGGRRMMALAYGLFALTLTGFAFANDLAFLLFFALFGTVMAILETTPRAFMARNVENEHYGTAIGMYQGATGVLVLPANLAAGFLWGWDTFGMHGTFVFSFIISVSAALIMLWKSRAKAPSPPSRRL